MPELCVMLDANAYRALSDERLTRLQAAEGDLSVVPCAHIFTCGELLARLTDTDARAAGSARSAVGRLARHCSEAGGQRREILFQEGPDRQLARALLRHKPPREERLDAFGALLGALSEVKNLEQLEPFREAIEKVRDFVHDSEARWVAGTIDQFVARFEQTSPAWAPQLTEKERRERTAELIRSPQGQAACARMFVDLTAQIHELALAEEVAAAAAQLCLQAFPVAVRLQTDVAARIILDPSLKLQKRANWVWDIQLSFSASPTLRVRGAPVWLVTADGDIRRAAEAAGVGKAILSLDEYEEVVLSGRERLREELARRAA